MPSQEFSARLLSSAHDSWNNLLSDALERVDPVFLDSLESTNWLPGTDSCFAAFSVPRCDVNVVWLGESPYADSTRANGVSFHDARVGNLFEGDYFNSRMKASLLNIFKAWFVAIGRLQNGTNRDQISSMRKDGLIEHTSDLFQRGRDRGWLWLNASLSLFYPQENSPPVSMQVCKWMPVIEAVLKDASERDAKVVLLGKFAEGFEYLVSDPLIAQHPAAAGYGFINNQEVQTLFRQWRVLVELENVQPG